jgi:transposase
MEAPAETSIRNHRHDRIAPGRIEVMSGPTGRRRWPDEAKGRIVAESFAGVASAPAVARRHGIVPSQLFAWRRLARTGTLQMTMTTACTAE